MKARALVPILGLVLLAGVAVGATPAYAETFDCTASLDGAQEVPPVETDGTGTASVTFDSDTSELSWQVEFSGLSGPATGAHFHGPAAEGENAGVQVNIGDISGLESPMNGTAQLTEEQASALTDGQMYINIHTEQNPDGEIRGQVTCESAGGEQPPGGQPTGGQQAGEWQNATVTIGGQDYDIQYMITNGTLSELTADPETQVLTAMITTEGDGELTIQLPREIIDSVENGQDADYIVYVDEIEEFPDDDYGQDVRTLTIPFENQVEQIDILGTSMVPEFSTLSAIVLAVAIVGIIAATTVYGKSRFLPKA